MLNTYDNFALNSIFRPKYLIKSKIIICVLYICFFNHNFALCTWSRTICAILIEGIFRNNSVKLL